MTMVRSSLAAALLCAVALPAAAQAPVDSEYHDRKSGLAVHSVSEPPANLPTLRTVNPTDRPWVVTFRAPAGPKNEVEQWDVGLVLPHDSMSMRVDTRGAAPTAITSFKATAPDSSHFWNLFWEANESALRNGNGLYPIWVKTDVVAFFSNPVDAPWATMAAKGHRAFMRVMSNKGSPVSPEIAAIVITAKPVAVAPPKTVARGNARRAADSALAAPQLPAVDLSAATPAASTTTAATSPAVEPPVAAPVSAPISAPASASSTVLTPPTAETPAPAASSSVLVAPTPMSTPEPAVEAPRPLEAPVAAPLVIAEPTLGDTAAFGWRAYARPPVAVISAGSWLFERPMPRYDKKSLTEVGAQSIMDVVIGAAPVPPMDRGALLREWMKRWNSPTGDWMEEQVVTRANEVAAPAQPRGARGRAAPVTPAHPHVPDLKALFAANGREAIRLLDDVLGLVQETP